MNVHPAKEEIRFAEPRFLYAWCSNLFKQKLYGNLSKTGLQPDIIFLKDRVSKTPPLRSSQSAERDISLPTAVESETDIPALDLSDTSTVYAAKESHVLTSPAPTESSELFDSISHDETGQKIAESIHIEAPYTNTQPLGRVIGQIHKTYIVAENDQGLVLVDQHAAHERLRYEKMKQDQTLYTPYALLVPEVLSVDSDAQKLLVESVTTLKHLGFCLRKQGDSLVLSEIPEILKEMSPSVVLESMILCLKNDEEEQGSKSSETSLKATLERLIWDYLAEKLAKMRLKPIIS